MQYLPKTFHKPLLLLSFFVMARQAKAQHADSAFYHNKVYYWIGAPIGFGTYLFNGGLDGGILLHNTFVVEAKSSFNINLDLFGSSYNKEADENALLFGLKVTHRRYSNLMVLAGISTVSVMHHGDQTGTANFYFPPLTVINYNTYSKVTVNTVGVPVAVKFLVAPVNFMAFDFTASANLNRERSFFALTFAVAWGHPRSGKGKPLPYRADHDLLRQLGLPHRDTSKRFAF